MIQDDEQMPVRSVPPPLGEPMFFRTPTQKRLDVAFNVLLFLAVAGSAVAVLFSGCDESASAIGFPANEQPGPRPEPRATKSRNRPEPPPKPVPLKRAEPVVTEPPPIDIPYPCIVMRGTVIYAHDADTIHFIPDVRVIKVRLLGSRPPGATKNRGVWSPEINRAAEKEAGMKARDYLVGIVGDGKNSVMRIPLDMGDELLDSTSFGRPMAEVWVNGVQIGEAVIAAGHATAEKQKDPQ